MPPVPATAPVPSSVADGTGGSSPTRWTELWFHTGTACNLDCPFCLEGSRPGDDRLQRITLADVRPLIDARWDSTSASSPSPAASPSW
jgi:hypothetical protein